MTISVLHISPPTKTFAGIESVIGEICDQLAFQMRDAIEVDVVFILDYATATASNRRHNKIIIASDGKCGLIQAVCQLVLVRPYDLVVIPQFEETVIAWFDCLGLVKHFPFYLHGNPKLELRSCKARVLFGLMNKIVLHRLAGVFGVSKDQIKAFQAIYPSKVSHFWVPNPLRRFGASPDVRSRSFGANGSGHSVQLVTYVKLGRYSYQKGHEILIRAFAKANAAQPNTRLVLVGYGPDERNARELIRSLYLDDCAQIVYHRDDPQRPLLTSDVYFSASRWEGWSPANMRRLTPRAPRNSYRLQVWSERNHHRSSPRATCASQLRGLACGDDGRVPCRSAEKSPC